jgi:RimJ/RimL family protein N-acetyltransferase
LLEKLGFTHEGTVRSGGVTAKGELVDGAIYGLLRSEWAPSDSRPTRRCS